MKIKFYLSLFFLLSASIESFAQTWQWAAVEGSSAWDEETHLCPDNKGGVFLTGNYLAAFELQGHTMPFNTFSAYFIAKLDASGAIVWVKTYTAKGHCRNIAADKDGNLYMAGDFVGDSYTADGVTLNYDATHGSAFIAKYNNDGTLLWAKNDFTNAAIVDMAVDTSGNVSFAGYYFNGPFQFAGVSHPLDNSVSSSAFDGFLAGYSTSGAPLWAKVLTGPLGEQITGVGCDANNNVYIAGLFTSKKPHFSDTTLVLNKKDTTVTSEDIFAAKFNSSGKLQWVRSAGGNQTASESSPGMTVDGSGNVTVASDFRLDSLTFDNTITIYGKSWCTETLIVTYDSNGTVKWANSSDGNLRIQANSLTTCNGNTYVLGEFSGSISSTTLQLNTTGSFDMYVAQLDPAGHWKWGIDIGGTSTDQATKITSDNGCNLYVAGITQSASITLDGQTYTGQGNANADFFYGKLALPVGIEEPSAAINAFSIYPNPMTSSSLLFFNSRVSNAEVKIIDMLGHEKMKTTFSGQVMNIEKASLAGGVYLLQVISGHETSIKKIVVE